MHSLFSWALGRWRLGWWLALLVWLVSPTVLAQPLVPIPALTQRVMDQAGLLAPAEQQALEAKLAAFEHEAGPQIVVLTVATTQPEDIAAFAQRVGDSWKIGRREVGDGLLIVVARDDRKLWIAPAKALEGAVPDLAARLIIRDAISPAFKRGDYAGGLSAGVDQLMARIRGEHLPAPNASKDGSGGQARSAGLGLENWAIFFFVGVPILGMVLTALLGRRLGSMTTGGVTGFIAHGLGAAMPMALGAGVLALVLVGLLGIGASGGRRTRMRRSGLDRGGPPIIFGGGGGGWGGGGGGFGSGGGGDFGGGGAGGDW